MNRVRDLTVTLFLLVNVVTAAYSQSSRFSLSGDLENFVSGRFDNGPSTVKYQIRWLSLHGDVDPSLRVVVGEVEYSGRDQLDENYVLLHNDRFAIRTGRIRPAFGISDWSENYYAGYTHLPMMRTARFGTTPALGGFSDGADVRWGGGVRQFQVGLVDNGPESWQVTPGKVNRIVARGQWDTNDILFAANILAGIDRNDSQATRLIDFDGHWSAPHVQVRGELLTGITGGAHPFGYYTDLFVHPPGLTRTTFLFRTEALLAPSPGSSESTGEYGTVVVNAPRQVLNQVQTLGLKQILNRYLVLQMSYGIDTHGSVASSMKGYGLELVIHTYL